MLHRLAAALRRVRVPVPHSNAHQFGYRGARLPRLNPENVPEFIVDVKLSSLHDVYYTSRAPIWADDSRPVLQAGSGRILGSGPVEEVARFVRAVGDATGAPFCFHLQAVVGVDQLMMEGEQDQFELIRDTQLVTNTTDMQPDGRCTEAHSLCGLLTREAGHG